MKIKKNIMNKNIICYELINSSGFQVNILNYGGIITDIIAPDRNGNLENVVLKYKDFKSYEKNICYFGAIIGRTAGRIAEGKVNLEGNTIVFNKGDDIHQSHGGIVGFDKKIWDSKVSVEKDRAILSLKYLSRDGEENYPGNIEVTVEYIVTENNELIINYSGESDKDTLLNMTNHSYFNLSGSVKQDILSHLLYVNSDFLVELDETQVPTGNLIPLGNTPFDFRGSKEIGKDIESDHYQIKAGSGYDHPWILKNGDNVKVSVYERNSGRALDIYTDRKAVVIYTMNSSSDENELYIGRKAYSREAVCFETQSPPIGRNNAFLEDSILKKGEKYKAQTIFKFYTKG